MESQGFRKPKLFKKKGKFDRKKLFKKKPKRSDIESKEIDELKSKYSCIQAIGITSFNDFPLSKKTRDGLKNGKYEKPTEIQRQSIGYALAGKDILGAAKTGSGKTLAFLLPILEGLYCRQWTKLDGLGALIISPTRELAFQTFEVLQKVGKFHQFSAGLVIGGKGRGDVETESRVIHQANIIVCTPGRLLQHMDETAHFNADNLQFLVLDEADRILDLGFAKEVDAIIENLPKERQTLLYSATQTRDVNALVNRLGVTSPMFVSVHENAKNSTPDQLAQSYIVCEQHEKINVLWSFLKRHHHSKIIIFLASCKQVRYVYETFKTMHPGLPVLALHGKMPQLRRMDVYKTFNSHAKCALFTTDVGARGLDFVRVQWVVQVDCPESHQTYTHRVGRTARMDSAGQSLLLLRPAEETGMLAQLTAAKIPLKKERVNRPKLMDIQRKLAAICAANIQMKDFAQAAFKSYLRTIHLMSNKEVFDVSTVDTDAFASSLGLVQKPKMPWLDRETERITKKREKLKEKAKWAEKAKSSEKKDTDSESEEESEEENEEKLAAMKKDKMSFNFVDDDDDKDMDFFTVKSKEDQTLPDTEELLPLEEIGRGKMKTKAAKAKRALHKNIALNKKTQFDEDGNVVLDTYKEHAPGEDDDEEGEEGGIRLDKAMKRMRDQDKKDKELYREKVKLKHREERLKEKERRRKKRKGEDEDDDEPIAMLPSDDDDEGPNLDYLPDPDKLYGPKDSDEDSEDEYHPKEEDEYPGREEEEEEEEEEDDSDEEEEEESEDEAPPAKKPRKDLKHRKFVTGNLEDDAATALKLLTG